MLIQHSTNRFGISWQTRTILRVFSLSLLGLLLLISAIALQPAQAQTSLPDMNLVRNAHVLPIGTLRLTPDQELQTGAAWLPVMQPVHAGFETTFDWKISKTAPKGSDGFAFVIHNAAIPLPAYAIGNGRNGLGYSGLPNSLAVEFDTVLDPPEDFTGGIEGDPNDNHISVQTRGKEANSANTDFSLGFTTQAEPAIPLFTVGRHTTKIVYTPGEAGKPGSMAIYLDKMDTPVLTVEVDLGTLLTLDEGKAWVGFTAATGRDPQTHDIHVFSFTPTQAAQ
jgi:hypothetical protein